MNRRELLKLLTATAGLGSAGSLDALLNATGQRFLIGACDWSIHQMAKTDAMETARQIGLDGVQLSLGTLADGMHLRRPEVQQAYREAAAKAGVRLGGLAIGEMNNIPYKSDPRAEEWVSDSIDVAKALGLKNVLLAFFDKGDINNDPQGQKTVIERLRKVAPKAEKAGVILGIESWMSARDHMKIIEAVGSKHVQVYYDVCNSNKMGYDIYKEIRWLGREHICEFHCKENGFLLGKGLIDFKKVRQAIDDIGYTGWLQIEGAVPEKAEMLPSYISNLAFLRNVFPASA